MSTRAIQYLRQKKIPFEVIRYDHAEKGAKFDKILINAGQRGAMLLIDPVDIRKTLACKVAKVAISYND
jgi:prolyl-tRNA editing enzyme YbaK/EbsC (Cys-tRNA(Pro) deacylase)